MIPLLELQPKPLPQALDLCIQLPTMHPHTNVPGSYKSNRCQTDFKSSPDSKAVPPSMLPVLKNAAPSNKLLKQESYISNSTSSHSLHSVSLHFHSIFLFNSSSFFPPQLPPCGSSLLSMTISHFLTDFLTCFLPAHISTEVRILSVICK